MGLVNSAPCTCYDWLMWGPHNLTLAQLQLLVLLYLLNNSRQAQGLQQSKWVVSGATLQDARLNSAL